MEFKDTMKNARKKWEVKSGFCNAVSISGSTSVKPPKVPQEKNCDDHRQGEIPSTCNTKKRKTIHACIIDAPESTGKQQARMQ